MISGCTILPDSKETKLGKGNQEVSPSVRKNAREVLVPCRARKCVPTAISGGDHIPEISGCHFLQQMSSYRGFKKKF